MAVRFVCSSVSALRLAAAKEWLRQREKSAPVLIVGATAEAVRALVREVAVERGSVFGWRTITLGRLAAELAQLRFAVQSRVEVSRLALEAICARVVHSLAAEDKLGRYAVIADRPGLPRALVRTLEELRMSDIARAGGDLDTIVRSFEQYLDDSRFADRALTFRVAEEVASRGGHSLIGSPLLLLDVPVSNELEARLVHALVAHTTDTCATVPDGDVRTLRQLSDALGVAPAALDDEATSSLRRLQHHLFAEVVPPASAMGDDVESFSAPGESRECVEIVRRVLRETARGVRFDRIAIVLRSPESYRSHLEEALRRADVPAYLAAGTRQPDPTGRAFLALLSCAAEGLSARRFAEYLSLAEVPDATAAGAPPAPPPSSDRWVPPEQESLPDSAAGVVPPVEDKAEAPPAQPEEQAVAIGTLRAPHRWERLLVDAAVIGGLDRWRRRLEGLAASFAIELASIDDPESPWGIAIRRKMSDLESLRSYALPLLAVLEELKTPATWGAWIDRLTALAAQALRYPDRVLAVLAELVPMAPVGPVDLREVRLVLSRRLTELVSAPMTRPYGHVYVSSVDGLRGLTFDIVFVPGLAERIFPHKVTEDPILGDDLRRAIGARLETNEDRAAAERLALRLAVGAANTRLVLSHPRLDLDQGRPRVPSFYALELVRAAEGRLPGFEEFSRRAERVGGGRIGWPAPSAAADAIDDAEYDLALLDTILSKPPTETRGMARYLLEANPFLARSLRARAQRWGRKWSAADGIFEPSAEAQDALAAHYLSARPYSPTALQHFSACPYRFLLHGILNLTPRKEPEAIEVMDPLQRGALVHDVLFELLGRLREVGLLPLNGAVVDRARLVLDEVLASVARKHRDELAPAIERVWDDGIGQVKADLVEWLRRACADDSGWTPIRFELAFGLKERRRRDPASQAEPVRLDCGIVLRGAIDLIEQQADGAIRVTDYKTGKDRAGPNMVVSGGETLQPLLYGLGAEKLFPSNRVDSGRLYYCTFAGNFAEHSVALNAASRSAASVISEVIDGSLRSGFIPAAPSKGACEWCDYAVVCGPFEEQRIRRKRSDALAALTKLRSLE